MFAIIYLMGAAGSLEQRDGRTARADSLSQYFCSIREILYTLQSESFMSHFVFFNQQQSKFFDHIC